VNESDSILFPRIAGGIFYSRFVLGVQITSLVDTSVTAALVDTIEGEFRCFNATTVSLIRQRLICQFHRSDQRFSSGTEHHRNHTVRMVTVESAEETFSLH
jgi:hypothetical protein